MGLAAGSGPPLALPPHLSDKVSNSWIWKLVVSRPTHDVTW